MPQIPLIMPQLGESIAEATVITLLVSEGQAVEAGQDVLEVETNKATMNVTSPCRGTVQNLLVQVNESYPVGAVLGHLEVSQEDAARHGLDVPAPEKERSDGEPINVGQAKFDGHDKERGVEPTVRGLPVPAHAA